MTESFSAAEHNLHRGDKKDDNNDKNGGGGGGGGIAWGGSLVGINNPDSLGYRTKRLRPNGTYVGDDAANRTSEEDKLPSSIVVQFRNRDGEECGGTIDVPMSSNSDQLGLIVHELKCDEEEDDEEKKEKNRKQRVPYSFYAKILQKNGVVDEIEVTTSLAAFVLQHEVSTEEILALTYQPLAIFRVRPVSRCTDTLPGHTEAILHLSYSPDSRHLASGGGDTTVRFWDVHTNLPKHTCHGHKDHVLCTSWSPDGKHFATGDKRGVVILWDPTSGKPKGSATIQAHRKYITSLAWEPHHRNKSCERLATASRDGLIKIWNARTKKCEVTMSGHVDSVECIKWGGEGLLYSGSRDRTIKVWAVDVGQKGKLVRTLQGHGHRVNTLALSCDYVCRTGPFDHKGYKTKFDSEDEAYEAAVKKYDEFKAKGENERLVSGSDDFTLFLWHPTEQKHPLKRLTGHQQLINHIAFSPDGRYFASGSFDKKVKIWCGKSGNFLSTLTGHVGAVYQVAWSSDGRFLVSASKDSTAKLWEMESPSQCKKAKETLPGHADEVYALDWCPNGSSVATGSKDRTIKIWKH